MADRGGFRLGRPSAKPLEVDRRRSHLRTVLGDALEALEVSGEQPLVGRAGPLGNPFELPGLEGSDLEEHVEPASPVRPGETEPHQAIHRRRQSAIRAGAGTEAERLAELAGRQLGGHLMSPQLGQAAQQERCAGPDDGRPAVLDVGVRQLEADLTDPRVRMVDGGEDKITITFHAPVGRGTRRIPRRSRSAQLPSGAVTAIRRSVMPSVCRRRAFGDEP